jgi:hypothetical protein
LFILLGRAPLLFLKRKNDEIGDKDDGSVFMARDEDDRSVTMDRDEDDHSVVMTRDEDDSFVAMVRDEYDRSVAVARDKYVAMAIDENENESSVAMAIDENGSFMAMAIDSKKLKGLPKEEPLSWFKQPWPIMFFDHNRSYRLIRYIENSPFTHLGLVRTEVSQHFLAHIRVMENKESLLRFYLVYWSLGKSSKNIEIF